MMRPLISSGSATSFPRPSWWYLHSLVAEVQFSEQRRCCAEETKRLGLSDLFSGRASCSLIRISNCGAVWESWGCSVTNTSSVSVPNQFPVVMADDTTDSYGPGYVLDRYISLSHNHTWKADNWNLLQRWWLSSNWLKLLSRELSLPSCSSTSTSAWVLASGGALLTRPPRLAWPTMRGLVLNWTKVGVLKGPTGFQTSPNLLFMAAFANLGSGWRSQKKSYMNNKLTGSFSLQAQEWPPALRPHSSAWPRDRECTSPCTLSSSCNSRKVLITKMCHSLNKVFFRYRHLLHWQYPALMQASLQPTTSSSESYTTEETVVSRWSIIHIKRRQSLCMKYTCDGALPWYLDMITAVVPSGSPSVKISTIPFLRQDELFIYICQKQL